jgi:hypothetical protein
MIWLIIIPVVVLILIAVGVVGRLQDVGCDDLGAVDDGIPAATVDQGSKDWPVYTYEDYARELGYNPDGVTTEDGKPCFPKR